MPTCTLRTKKLLDRYMICEECQKKRKGNAAHERKDRKDIVYVEEIKGVCENGKFCYWLGI